MNLHVEIKPIEMEGFVSDASGVFEEKGEVISIADGILDIEVGQIVYFDSWVAAKFPDATGNIRYLIPSNAVRAIEYVEQVPE